MKDKDTTKDENPTREKRRILSELSRDAEAVREGFMRAAEQAGQDNKVLYWASKTINYMLLNHIYETEGATEFKTFMQWKQEGATVKKGAKAFLIWGQPLGTREEEKEKGISPEDFDSLFFPLCYLFSDKQVIKAADRVKPETEGKDPAPVLQEAETITDEVF
ncbi:MAG: hypothetical protein FD166_1449 [Bacteroidetes bacterium]|nr:MAG: hypothetical protein FD166_1449 [Bacteroidota bacterium]